MKVELKFAGNYKINGYNSEGALTSFDAPESIGGDNSAAKPMEVMLESLGACSFIDTMSILRKKRKTITDFQISIEAERAETLPKVFNKVELKYSIWSPDTKLEELEKAANLSQEKYCSVSAMFRNSGCEIKYSCEVIND